MRLHHAVHAMESCEQMPTCRTLCASKGSMLLLNKADLLPEELRTLWADYFDRLGVRYAFWSAFACIQRQKVEGTAAARKMGLLAPRAPEPADARIRLLDEGALITLFSDVVSEARCEAAAAGDSRLEGHAPTVGLIGFPNVGKSSTINALFGSKKTAVAATPGKTKHFQTLHISDDLVLCDCPGLVLPKFASSRADMVAAGVVPIDRLSEMHTPIATIARRISRHQLFSTLRISTIRPADHEPPDRVPTGGELLRALALSRGWLNGSGLPDETRAGRQILKEYTSGRLVFCEWPPGTQRRCPYDDGLRSFTARPELLHLASRAAPSFLSCILFEKFKLCHDRAVTALCCFGVFRLCLKCQSTPDNG
jgi:large subunit GTPase 1